MIVLSLDTTSRQGSVAVLRDGAVVGIASGDPARTHGERLPGEILDLLRRHDLTLADVDLYGVAAGPGSFTGLRVGIATMQGLALVHGKPMVGVSALDALAAAAMNAIGREGRTDDLIGCWIDAQRGEVFAALYRLGGGSPDDSAAPDLPIPGTAMVPVLPPSVESPAATLSSWGGHLQAGRCWVAGDGAIAYRENLHGTDRPLRLVEPAPLLAASIGSIASAVAEAGGAAAPGAIRPLYVRRPDAELARARARAAEAQPVPRDTSA